MTSFSTRTLGRRHLLSALLLLLGFMALSPTATYAQGVAGGTVISNRANVVYTEPNGGNVQTFSNQVTVTVQNVTGLTITPDAGTAPGVNAGASNVTRVFQINNTGNITESIQFGSGGASLITSGPITVTAAYVDVNGNSSFDAGDIDIRTSTGPLSMNFQTSVNVVVVMDVSPTATAGSTISLQLGDASTNAPSHDNVPADLTPGSVKTTGSTGINGNLEARGDLTFNVDAAGNVLIGPSGQPAAVGPTDNNDDYTNRTMTLGVAAPFGGTTSAAQQVTFINTVRNGAVASDNIGLTLRAIPNAAFAGAYEMSVDNGATFVPFPLNGTPVMITVPAGSNFDVRVRVTVPAGQSVLTGYTATIRATSGITPQNFNETLDRTFSGFIRVDKSVLVTNATGIGGANAAVPGAVIEYTLTYTNVSATAGTNNANLTATNLTVTEDGNESPNNWAGTTNHVAGSASDTRGGTITGDTAGSSVLTDVIPSLAPGQSGVFKFRRVIR